MHGTPNPVTPRGAFWLRRWWRRRRGPAGAPYSALFNTPLKWSGGRWHSNERMVEIPFVLSQIDVDGGNRRALEFGCTRSELALYLASLGYQVTAIDLRPYPFSHPNLSFRQHDLLELDESERFDLITAVSVLEHVGLGAYGERARPEALREVAARLSKSLRRQGMLLVTVPVGRPSHDRFLRSFAVGELERLVASPELTLELRRYFIRQEQGWFPATAEEVAAVSNHSADRGPTGVNSVGCFAWIRGA